MGGPRGAGEIAAGAMNAVFMLVTVLVQLGMPWLLRRIDHRVALGLGTALIGAPTPLYALSGELWLLLGVSGLRGIGFGLLTVAGSAMVAELFPPQRRGRAAGAYGLAVGLPNFVLLPVGVWFAQTIGFAPLFWIAGVAPLLATAAVLGIAPVRARRTSGRRAFPVVLLPSWLVMTASSIAAGGLLAFLPLAVGAVSPLALMAFGGCSLLGRFAAGQWADRRGAAAALTPALCCTGAGALLLSVASWGPEALAVLGAAAFGLGFGAVQNSTLVMMFERAASGPASTAWNIAFDAGNGLGSVGFGLFITWSGYPGAFAAAAVLVLLCTPLALGSARRPVPDGSDAPERTREGTT
ncbi:MFS transporter [Saccharopolyspora sp. CA-218241]|uniref:MFS transporter n=1 Tax=Saccharopolyspora sp. CA-218241 TaxID=3240027 RepID=UPI003D9894F4